MTPRQVQYAESAFALVVLFASAAFTSPWSLASWTAAIAVFGTFVHMQVADEGAKSLDYRHALNATLVLKEIAWITTFILLGSWPALVGCFLFLAYPFWRGWVRKRVVILSRTHEGDRYDGPRDLKVVPKPRPVTIAEVARRNNLLDPVEYAALSVVAQHWGGPFPRTPLTRTGRTTAMLLEAATLALDGHDVRIRAHDARYTERLVREALLMARVYMDVPGTIRRSDVATDDLGFQGALLFDHYNTRPSERHRGRLV